LETEQDEELRLENGRDHVSRSIGFYQSCRLAVISQRSDILSSILEISHKTIRIKKSQRPSDPDKWMRHFRLLHHSLREKNDIMTFILLVDVILVKNKQTKTLTDIKTLSGTYQ
jgi:hypothetical protein